MKAIIFICFVAFCAAVAPQWGEDPTTFEYLNYWGPAIRISKCFCYEKGNYYNPISSTDCRQFHQRTPWLPPVVHYCPAGLIFDVNTCVCNWPSQTTCPEDCPEIPIIIDPPKNCTENGNIYAPVPGTNCESFTQETALLPPVRHNCPAGLQFDLETCVCNWPWATECNV